MILSLGIFGYFANQYGHIIRAAMSDVDTIETYSSAFKGYTFVELVQMRYENKYSGDRGTMSRIAYKLGGVFGLLIRIIYFFLFPIRFYSLYMAEMQRTVWGMAFVQNGFFIFNFFKWLMILCWVFVLPLTALGILKSVKGNFEQKNALILYIMSILGVAIVSLHNRHSLSFVILTPIFVNIGYNYVKEKELKILPRIMQASVLLALLSYNLITSN